MKKDDEENKKKMFNFAKQLKDNARKRRSLAMNNTIQNAANLVEQNALPASSNDSIDQPTTSNADNSMATSKNTTAINNTISTTNASNSTLPTSTFRRKDNPPNNNNENNCSICLRENNNPALCNECYHCFCFSCIQQWSEQSNQCPVCRREYSIIYYNIRSENEYDELPVQRRRRQNEFEIILPLGNLIELDRTFERLINMPPMIFPSAPISPLPSIFLPTSPQLITNPIDRAIAEDALRQQLTPPRTENLENTITFTVTNFNQPDESGRVIQRTLFFADPSVINNAMSTLAASPLADNTTNFRTQSTNTQTPVSSLEQNRHLHSFNPFLMTEPISPTVNNEPFLLSTWNPFPTASTFSTNPIFDARTSGTLQEDRPRTIENIFDRIFNDLTQSIIPTTNQTNIHQRTRSFPISEINNLRTSTDQNSGIENQDSDDENENTMISSSYAFIRRPNQRIPDSGIRRRRRRSNENRTNRQLKSNSRPTKSSRSVNNARNSSNRGSNRNGSNNSRDSGNNSKRSGSSGSNKGSSSGKNAGGKK